MAAPTGPPRNRLLGGLTRPAWGRLAPKLSPTALHAKQLLYRPDQPITQVYFPETTVICLMAMMPNGDTIETATVGREGASWISASVGAPSMPCETIVVVAGDALALPIEDLDIEMQENAPFRDLLTQYSHALLIHSMRMTVCTGLHSLHQRCARWMLTTLDRVVRDRFAVTHQLLAMLIGASRPSVSSVIGDFQKQGLVRGERGRLIVDNRRGLRAVSCGCYGVIKRNYAQVGLHPGRARKGSAVN